MGISAGSAHAQDLGVVYELDINYWVLGYSGELMPRMLSCAAVVACGLVWLDCAVD